MHVDFVRVRADQTIQAEIPVHLIGDAEGAARGGVLEQLVHTLTVEAKPGDLPPSIEHDVTALEIGDGCYVRDLAMPAGVTVLQNADELVAQISAPRVAEEADAGRGRSGRGRRGRRAAAPRRAEGESRPRSSRPVARRPVGGRARQSRRRVREDAPQRRRRGRRAARAPPRRAGCKKSRRDRALVDDVRIGGKRRRARDPD